MAKSADYDLGEFAFPRGWFAADGRCNDIPCFDGPFRQTRIWRRQFFNPRARAEASVRRVEGLHSLRGVPAFTPALAD